MAGRPATIEDDYFALNLIDHDLKNDAVAKIRPINIGKREKRP